MDDLKRKYEELVHKLNEASEAYYNGKEEIMSNYEWDAMFDEISELEDKTGYILPESPTRNAGYEESAGEREAHEFPALSLAKTKQVDELKKWAENRPIWLSWKLDGLTLVLTYDNAAYIFIDGIDEKYKNLNANYLMRWKMIEDYNNENLKYINLNGGL